MNILIVAPEIENLPKLAQSTELTRLEDVTNLSVKPLTGTLVTSERIQNRLRSGKYDVLLWSGHGSNGRLLLPKGKEIEPRWLASEVKHAGISLVVLSVCDSAQRKGYEGFADILPANNISLIGMSVGISDISAVEYNISLLHALANRETLRNAHRIGLESINGADKVSPQLFIADYENAEQLKEKVDELQSSIDIGDSTKTIEIIEECHTILEDLHLKYNGLHYRLNRVEKKLNPPKEALVWRFVAMLILFTAASFLFILQLRSVIFDPWWVGVLFEFFLCLFAIMCWRMNNLVIQRNQ